MRRLLKFTTAIVGAGMLVTSVVAQAEVPAKRLYARSCSSCHGADGSGNADMATNTLHVDANLMNLARPEAAGITRDQKRVILLKGKGRMPAYEGKLTPDQVDPVLDYAIQITEALRKK